MAKKLIIFPIIFVLLCGTVTAAEKFKLLELNLELPVSPVNVPDSEEAVPEKIESSFDRNSEAIENFLQIYGESFQPGKGIYFYSPKISPRLESYTNYFLLYARYLNSRKKIKPALKIIYAVIRCGIDALRFISFQEGKVKAVTNGYEIINKAYQELAGLIYENEFVPSFFENLLSDLKKLGRTEKETAKVFSAWEEYWKKQSLADILSRLKIKQSLYNRVFMGIRKEKFNEFYQSTLENYFQHLRAIVAKDYHLRKKEYETFRRDLDKVCRESRTARVRLFHPESYLVYLILPRLLPELEPVFEKLAVVRCFEDALPLIAWIKLYKRHYFYYPTSLKRIKMWKPRVELPPDPFTGENYGYRGGLRSFTLYSASFDGKDDRGDPGKDLIIIGKPRK